MEYIEHPSQMLSNRAVELIRRVAPKAEISRQLQSDQLELIYKQRWLKMFVPKKSGGLELSIPKVLSIEESLAWADGSTGWLITLCAGAAWFVGFLHPELTREIFINDAVCIAGSGSPSGSAEITPEGYLLNGYWKYASGSLHATAFTANCLIKKNGKQLLNKVGKPLIMPFLMKPDEVTIHKTWNSTGMIATGSNSFEVKNLMLSESRSFHVNPGAAVIDNPVFRYPFLQLAETTLTVNLSGLAVRFLDLCEEIVSTKTGKSSPSTKRVRQAKQKLNNKRIQFFNAAGTSWKSCVSKDVIPATELRKVSSASHQLAKQALQSVDQTYPLCGLIAADAGHEINRVWRDIHTASQHSLFKI